MDNKKLRIIVRAAISVTVTVALIIGAASKQPYSYYNLLRWLVTISFVYFAYLSLIHWEIGFLIFYAFVAVLFNPFRKFTFQREIWHMVEYAVALITLLILIYKIRPSFRKLIK